MGTLSTALTARMSAAIHCIADVNAMTVNYVAAKATYIRLLHGKIGFWGFFSALAP